MKTRIKELLRDAETVGEVEKMLVEEGALDRLTAAARAETKGQFASAYPGDACASVLLLRAAARILVGHLPDKDDGVHAAGTVLLWRSATTSALQKALGPKLAESLPADMLAKLGLKRK